MSDDLFKAYVRDLSFLIKEMAFEAKRTADTSQSESSPEFYSGRLMAFHEIVSLMQQQAEAFGITLDEIGLAGIDPEKMLL